MGNSVCAFLQANSKGVSSFSYCNCTSADDPRGTQTPCPLNWDPYDGKSITQSVSDQYKFCGSAPTLKICNSARKVAYTSYQYYDRFTGERRSLKDEIHCICPEGHNYLDTKYRFFREGSTDVVVTLYFCLPLQQCEVGAFCKDVTDIPGEFLVNPKCKCPEHLSCPTVTNRGISTTVFGQAKVHNILCQAAQSHRHLSPLLDGTRFQTSSSSDLDSAQLIRNQQPEIVSMLSKRTRPYPQKRPR